MDVSDLDSLNVLSVRLSPDERSMAFFRKDERGLA